MKRALLIMLMILSLGGGVVIYRERAARAVINQGLSKRSQKFLATQSKNDQWRYVNFEGQKEQNKREYPIEVEGCFSFLMPFPARLSRKDRECEVSYGLSAPRATLVMYRRASPMANFDAIPGVSMRRRFTETYKEEEQILSGKKYLLFTQKKEEAVVSAFYFEPQFYFSASIIGANDERTKKEFMKLLESVKFYTNTDE